MRFGKERERERAIDLWATAIFSVGRLLPPPSLPPSPFSTRSLDCFSQVRLRSTPSCRACGRARSFAEPERRGARAGAGGVYRERGDYILVTNFDFFWHDLREWFDPTGGYSIGHRRVEAQKLLNATKEGSLTSEYLYEVISSKGVASGPDQSDGTIFQAIINVEKSL